MFWQGGGKKRLKNQIEQKMETAPFKFEPGRIGRNDEELLAIYYHRDQLMDKNKEQVLPLSIEKKERQPQNTQTSQQNQSNSQETKSENSIFGWGVF